MFKKLVIQSSNKLRSSDVKRLRKDAQLSLPSLSDADIETIFPSKCAPRGHFFNPLTIGKYLIISFYASLNCLLGICNPDHRADVIVTKVNHRALLYSVNNGNPLFFDPVWPEAVPASRRWVRPYISCAGGR